MKQSETNISAIILGSKESVAYFSKLVYADAPKEEFLGKRTFTKIASSAKKGKDDITIVETSWLFSRFFQKEGFFISPRINFVLDISHPLAMIVNRFSEGKKRGIDKVVKTGFTYEITKDPDEIDSFFSEIYLPHMAKRFGKGAVPVRYSEFKELSLKGDLVLLKMGQDVVSGTILVPHENELHAPVLAVKDVDKQLTLCTYALYYYTIVLGIQKGYSTVDFGETAPFLMDGVFKYKKDFGMRIRPAQGSSAQVFGIRFSNLNEPVKNFLKTNPFVLIDEKNLSSVVFADSINDLSKSIYVPGLSSLYVISSNNLDRSNQQGAKVQRLSMKDHQNKPTSALESLIRICREKGCSVFRIDL